jgi:hypothetical protein
MGEQNFCNYNMSPTKLHFGDHKYFNLSTFTFYFKELGFWKKNFVVHTEYFLFVI